MSFVSTESFDSYSNGDNINTKSGGSGWAGNWVVGSGTWTVTTAQHHDGTNSLTSATFGSHVYRAVQPQTVGEMSFYMRRDTNTTKAWYLNLCDSTTLGAGTKVVVGMEVGNIVAYDNSTQRILVSSFNANQWYKIKIKYGHVSNKFAVSIDDGAYSADYAFSFGGTGAITYAQFYEGAGGSGTHNVWIDEITPVTPPQAVYVSHGDEDGVGYDASHVRLGQPFTVSNTSAVTSVDAYYLAKNGSPTDNVLCDIYSDSGGSPGSILETSSTSIDSSTLPARGTVGPQTFTFAGTTTLTAGTTYWLVFRRSGSVSANFAWYGIGNTAIPFSVYHYYNGTNWSSTGSAGYNMDFALYGTAGGGAIATLPTLMLMGV